MSGSGGTSIYLIGLNDKTVPTDRNTFSAKRIIDEIERRSLSSIEDDKAEGLITFGKGFVSEGFSAANGGLIVRGGELIEEVEDSLIEELE